MDEKIIKGTPPMVLLPAKDYFFKVKDEHYIITIPRKGNYHDIDPDVFSEDDGDFNILDDGYQSIYTPTITKVLFATKKYPDLEFNQFFVPYLIEFKEDTVNLVGQIVSMVIAVKDDDEE